MSEANARDGSQQLASGKLIHDHPSDGVARLRIVNPEKRGALDHEILDAIAQVVPQINARCLIVTGDDRMFSAGYDIGGLPDDRFAEEAEKLVAHPFTEAITAIEEFPYPTLAAINGHAIGGGLELALACDMRICAEGVKLGMPPAKLGLVYSHAGLEKFIATIGPAHTAQLFYTAENISSEVGCRWGLVNEIYERAEIEPRSLAIAASIAANAPLSLTGNKSVIRRLMASDQLDAETEAELVELRRRCFLSDDFREGVKAFEEKRPPHWTGK